MKKEYWKNLSIAKKYRLFFAAILIILLVFASISYFSFSVVSRVANEDMVESIEVQALIMGIKAHLEQARRHQYEFIFYQNSIGVVEASQQYGFLAIDTIKNVKIDVRELKEIVQTNNGKKYEEFDLNLLTVLLERFSSTSMSSVETMSLLGSDKGLEHQLENHSNYLYDFVQSDNNVLDGYREMKIAEHNYIMSKDRPYFQAVLNEIAAMKRNIATGNYSADEASHMNEILDNYKIVFEETVNKNNDFKAQLNDFNLQFEAVDEILDRLIIISNGEVKIARKRIESTKNNMTILIAFVFVLLVSFLYYVSRILYFSITKNILDITDVAEKYRKGNLRLRSHVDSKDEIGVLSKAFNEMAKDLGSLISNLEGKVKDRTKELLRANRKLKELDKVKDQFISIAAHELKTPLTSIRGFTQLMRDPSVMRNEKKSIHNLDVIERNVDRLYNLVIDLVDSTRINVGKLQVSNEVVGIESIFSEIEQTMKPVIVAKGLEAKFACEENLYVNADLGRVLQIIRNFISNSVNYTEKGEVAFDIFSKGEKVIFRVSDTGVGIPKSQIENIFKRFYQIDRYSKGKIKGSGLGLSICKGLAKLMQGKIWAESDGKTGSTFYLSLPKHKKES